MILLKIGGGATINLEAIADEIGKINEPLIIVNGANATRDRLASELDHPIETVTSVSGQTSVLTDERVIDLMMMAYAGLANKKLVELLQRRGVNAVGLSGLDGRIVQARRNPGIRVKQGEKTILVRDLSGRASSINRELLELLLSNGYTPVLTMPLADENGHAVNSENDDVIAALHSSLNASRIVFLVEAPGLLENPENHDSLIPRLDMTALELMQASTNGRMRRKLRSIHTILDSHPAVISIADGRTSTPISDALAGRGTVIQ